MTNLKQCAIRRRFTPLAIIFIIVIAIPLSAYHCRIGIYNIFCQTQIWMEQLNQYETVRIITNYTGKLDSTLSLLLLWIETGLLVLLALFFIVRKWFVGYCLRSHEILAYKSNQILVLQREIRKVSENDSGLLVNMTTEELSEFKVHPNSFQQSQPYNLLNLGNHSFCYFSFLNGDFWETSFEKRNTDVWEENGGNRELQLKMECIYAFYENLKRKAGDGNLKEVFTGLQYVYNKENLKEAITYVNDHRYELGMAFIGDKIGLLDYRTTSGKTILYVYKTDHFTWKVCKYLYEKYQDRFIEVFQLIERYSQNVEKRSLLMKSLFLLFSSMGVDAIVHGSDSNGIRHFLMTLRSGRLNTDGISRIHISVDESFSFTDIEANNPSCDTWLKRGVAEEIGYPGMDRKKQEMKVTFCDFAITYQLGEIGLCADVEINHIERVPLFPAQDKYLESDAMFCIPFPYRWYNLYKFWMWSNPAPDYIRKIIMRNCKDERLKMKWVSFAPLVYARFFIRRFSFNKIGGNVRRAKKTGWFFINLIVIFMLLFLNNIINSLPWYFWSYMALMTVVGIIIFKIWSRKKRGASLFGTPMRPLVPQWTGDVHVLQNTIAGHPYEARNIYLHGKSDNSSNDLKQYVVKGEPKCAVRARNGQVEEVPMVFLNIAPIRYKTEKGKIHFPLFHITESEIYYYQLYTLKSDTEKEKPQKEQAKLQTLSFIFSEGEASMCNAKIDEDLFNNLHYYFNLPQEELMAENIQGKGSGNIKKLYNLKTSLRMTDLFRFDDDFYFISKMGEKPDLSVLSHVLGNEKDVKSPQPVSARKLKEKYTGIDKGGLEGYRVIKGTDTYLFVLYSFQLATEGKQLTDKIIKSWLPTNGRLTELEVLALQFLLIRNEPVIYLGK